MPLICLCHNVGITFLQCKALYMCVCVCARKILLFSLKKEYFHDCFFLFCFVFSANRRLRRNRDNLLPSSQSGRVYFSDVSELRSAAREMQGFRITSNVFRNTGFGTTQAISHLK